MDSLLRLVGSYPISTVARRIQTKAQAHENRRDLPPVGANQSSSCKLLTRQRNDQSAACSNPAQTRTTKRKEIARLTQSDTSVREIKIDRNRVGEANATTCDNLRMTRRWKNPLSSRDVCSKTKKMKQYRRLVRCNSLKDCAKEQTQERQHTAHKPSKQRSVWGTKFCHSTRTDAV